MKILLKGRKQPSRREVEIEYSESVKRQWITLTAESVHEAIRFLFYTFGESNFDGFQLKLKAESVVDTVAIQEGDDWDDDIGGIITITYPSDATIQDLLDYIVDTPEVAAEIELVEDSIVGDTSESLIDISIGLTIVYHPTGVKLHKDALLFSVIGVVEEAFNNGASITDINDGRDGGDSSTITLDLTIAPGGTRLIPAQLFTSLDPPIYAINKDVILALNYQLSAPPTVGKAHICFLIATAP